MPSMWYDDDEDTSTYWYVENNTLLCKTRKMMPSVVKWTATVPAQHGDWNEKQRIETPPPAPVKLQRPDPKFQKGDLMKISGYSATYVIQDMQWRAEYNKWLYVLGSAGHHHWEHDLTYAEVNPAVVHDRILSITKYLITHGSSVDHEWQLVGYLRIKERLNAKN